MVRVLGVEPSLCANLARQGYKPCCAAVHYTRINGTTR